MKISYGKITAVALATFLMTNTASFSVDAEKVIDSLTKNNIEELVLDKKYTNDELTRIGSSLKDNTSVKNLRLYGDLDIEMLKMIQGCRNKSIASLTLSVNKINIEEAEDLLLLLEKNKSITSLNLGYSLTNTVVMKWLFNEKNKNSLTNLDLFGFSWNCFIKSLGPIKHDKNLDLSGLWVYYNKISDLLKYNYKIKSMSYSRNAEDKKAIESILKRNKNHQTNNFLNFLSDFDLNIIYK